MDEFKAQLDSLLAQARRVFDEEDQALREIYGLIYRHRAGKDELLRFGQLIAGMRTPPQYPPQQMAPQQEPPDPEQLRRWHEAVGRPHPGSNGTVPHYNDDRVG